MADTCFTPTPPPLRERSLVSDALLGRLAAISSGSLATQLFKKGFRQPALSGLSPLQAQPTCFAGRAFTMRMIPAREDIDTYATLTAHPNADNLQWVAVEQTQAGDVLVIDSRGDGRAASMGDLLIRRLQRRGVRAVVTDGGVRDASAVAALDLPCWSAGRVATTRLSYHHVADLQVPVSCAGVAVYPGDVIHGDADGVCVIPAHLAVEMAELCEAQDDIEAYLAQRIAQGEALWGVYPPSEATRVQYRAWVAEGRPALAGPP
jgi:regulator of RNase E activity RraA